MITCTLVLVFKTFVLTRQHGLIPFLIPFLSIATSTYSFEPLQLTYDGYKDKHPIQINYSISATENSRLAITVSIDTDIITDHHISIIDTQSKSLSYLSQSTTDTLKNEEFIWSAQRTSESLSISYKNFRFNDLFSSNIPTSKNPITMQGLLGFLLDHDLYLDDTITAELLTPWKSVIPIKLTVDEVNQIAIGNSTIDTYRLTISLNMIFGKLFPKSMLWVTKASPIFWCDTLDKTLNYQLSEI